MISRSEELEIRISSFLRYGVLAAGALMLGGWLIHVDLGQNPFAQFSEYHERPLGPVLLGAFETFDTATLLAYGGLFCLISLPIIRVMLTALLFVKEQDFIMAFLAGTVFASLILSFALGLHIG